MKVSTAQRLHKIMAGPVGTMAVGITVSLMLLAAGFLTAVVVMGTVTTPGNPNVRPEPTPDVAAQVCLRIDTCIEGLWVDVADMPTDPYEQCLYLTSLPQRTGLAGLAPELCEPIEEQRG